MRINLNKHYCSPAVLPVNIEPTVVDTQRMDGFWLDISLAPSRRRRLSGSIKPVPVPARRD